MRQFISLVFALAALPLWASDPGEPLSYEDWVILEPGVAVVPVGPSYQDQQCPSSTNDWFDAPLHCRLGRVMDTPGSWKITDQGTLTDPTGNVWVVSREVIWTGECTVIGFIRGWWNVDRCAPNGECATVARLPTSRCAEIAPIAQADVSYLRSMWLDNSQGFLYIRVRSQAALSGAYRQEQIVRLIGLTTLFEILQTYTPTANEIGFRVPYMPEGFQSADYFDTYWGNLATVGDWSQAQPLQCSYPATPPGVGDYLTVADTLPPLQPGQGRYYVTAMHHQGQTRYGRKSSGGVLTGRDPSLLPGCSD